MTALMAVPVVAAEGRFAGRVAFAEMIRQGSASAASARWREIVLSDTDYADWPLDERSVAEDLQRWTKTGGRLTMLARRYDTVLRRHARFVVWRRNWSHRVECRAVTAVMAASADDLPSAFWSPDWAFERLDIRRCAGVAGSEAGRNVALKERLNEALLQSVPAFPATVLGL